MMMMICLLSIFWNCFWNDHHYVKIQTFPSAMSIILCSTGNLFLSTLCGIEFSDYYNSLIVRLMILISHSFDNGINFSEKILFLPLRDDRLYAAIISLPDRAFAIRGFTFPPTPAIHDISAIPSRSILTATSFASWAILLLPEHEYTSGSFSSSLFKLFSRFTEHFSI